MYIERREEITGTNYYRLEIDEKITNYIEKLLTDSEYIVITNLEELPEVTIDLIKEIYSNPYLELPNVKVKYTSIDHSYETNLREYIMDIINDLIWQTEPINRFSHQDTIDYTDMIRDGKVEEDLPF